MIKKYFTSKNFSVEFCNLFENSFNQIFKKLVLLCFTLLTAQVSKSNDRMPQVMEVKSLISAMKKSEQNSRSAKPESKRLENLLITFLD
jgi:hypothetical protein